MSHTCVLLLLMLNAYSLHAQYKMFDLLGLEVRYGDHYLKENGWAFESIPDYARNRLLLPSQQASLRFIL